MLKSEELKELNKLSPVKASFYIFSDWLIIIFSFVIAIHFPNPFVILLCAIIIARTQLALALIMHDGVHSRLYNNRIINDFVGQFFSAGPIMFSFFSYKHNHLKHHKDPLVKDDPDITLIGGYPISLKSFLRKIFRDLCGISYFKFIKYFLYSSHKRRKNVSANLSSNHLTNTQGNMPLWLITFSIVFSNFLIFICLYYSGHPIYYLLWILPTMTILQFLLRIRGIAEHAGYQPNSNQMLNARTIVNPIQTFFFAPHNVNYHIEHHIYVAIPFYNLPKAHELLMKQNFLPENNLYKSYWQIIRELIK